MHREIETEFSCCIRLTCIRVFTKTASAYNRRPIDYYSDWRTTTLGIIYISLKNTGSCRTYVKVYLTWKICEIQSVLAEESYTY